MTNTTNPIDDSAASKPESSDGRALPEGFVDPEQQGSSGDQGEEAPQHEPVARVKTRKPVSWLTPVTASLAAAGIALVAFAGGAGTVAAVQSINHADQVLAQSGGHGEGRGHGDGGGHGAELGDRSGGQFGGKSPQGGMRGMDGGQPGGIESEDRMAE